MLHAFEVVECLLYLGVEAKRCPLPLIRLRVADRFAMRRVRRSIGVD